MPRAKHEILGRRLLRDLSEEEAEVVKLEEDKNDPNREKGNRLREQIITRFGFVPRSILSELSNYHDPALDAYVDDQWGKTFQNSFRDTRRRRAPVYEREKERLREVIGDDIDLSEFEKRNRNGHGLSQFGVGIAQFCIQMWSEEGDTLFDPFSGRLPRLLLAHKLRRHAIGYDLSEPFARWNKARLERLKQEEAEKLFCEEREYRLEYHNADSRKIHLPGESVDYVLTSPPYWHQEYYGPEEGQLGWIGTYAEFLQGMKDVMSECFRILKPGKFCTFVIQNLRDSDGSYVHYTSDLSVLMREAKFKIWDEAVYQIGAMTAITTKNALAHHTAKSHESIITARKT